MEREYRMYGLTLYNISEIQKGIQFGHAVVEYSLKYGRQKDYLHWATKNKTFIILNGGTTNNSYEYEGSLNKHEYTLKNVGKLKIATFNEPDLGDQLTAIVFLVDDRVFNKELWPDFKLSAEEQLYWNKHKNEYENLDEYIKQLFTYIQWKNKFSINSKEINQIIWLRDYLKNLRLA